MSPVASHKITLGQGGEQHDAADAILASFLVRRFEGKVAIVTGAGSGIGRGTARRLAAEGASVAALDVMGDAVADTVAGITADGGTAVAYTCDVTSEGSVTSTVDSVVADLGAPSVVCNVAGIGGFFNSHDMPFDRWQQILGVNLTGPFLVCRAALPYLLEQGGAIVNVCSNTALMGQAYSAAYCASKGGAAMLTRALAVEYLESDVRVNGVAPGGVDTPLVHDFGFPEGASFKAFERIMTPKGYCTPAEIASAIAFIASDEAAYATGAILSIDGGLST